MTISIRSKLLVLGIVSSAAALVLSSMAILVSSYFIQRADIVRSTSAQASIVADNTTAAIRFDDSAAANETLAALRAIPSIDVACVFDGDGALVGSYVSAAATEVCPSLPPDDETRATWTRVSVVRPVMIKNARVGTVSVQANLSEVWHRLQTDSIAVLVAFAIGSIGALLLARRLREAIYAPVLALSTTAAEISRHGDYSLRASKQGTDEIGVLVDTFNGMMQQAELRDAELRSANRLKDEFLATLSHELRTPLNAIVGWLHVLRMSPSDPAVAERAFTGLDRNAKIQVRLIEDLLDISSIERGQLRMTFSPVDLLAVLKGSIEVVKAAADDKGVAIALPSESSPRVVMGDAGRLEQVIWNLLSNAIKFTPKGGEIRTSLRESAGKVILEITDTGIGINEDFLPYVFDRFRQADGSMTRRYGGLGVGLAIAFQLVVRHGGAIVANSKGAGMGATFTVTLPAATNGSATE